MLDFSVRLEYVSEVSFVCRCSSVVEHVIGNDGVVSPILISGTIFLFAPFWELFLFVGLAHRESDFGNLEN